MNLTVLFIGLIFIAIVIFDVFIIAKKGKSESISAWIIRESRNYPLMVLLFGIVLGHLFWSMGTKDIYPGLLYCEKVDGKLILIDN